LYCGQQAAMPSSSWMPAFAGMTSNNQRFAGRMLRKSRRM
jgi:hypothetical protein